MPTTTMIWVLYVNIGTPQKDVLRGPSLLEPKLISYRTSKRNADPGQSSIPRCLSDTSSRNADPGQSSISEVSVLKSHWRNVSVKFKTPTVLQDMFKTERGPGAKFHPEVSHRHLQPERGPGAKFQPGAPPTGTRTRGQAPRDCIYLQTESANVTKPDTADFSCQRVNVTNRSLSPPHQCRIWNVSVVP